MADPRASEVAEGDQNIAHSDDVVSIKVTRARSCVFASSVVVCGIRIVVLRLRIGAARDFFIVTDSIAIRVRGAVTTANAEGVIKQAGTVVERGIGVIVARGGFGTSRDVGGATVWTHVIQRPGGIIRDRAAGIVAVIKGEAPCPASTEVGPTQVDRGGVGPTVGGVPVSRPDGFIVSKTVAARGRIVVSPKGHAVSIGVGNRKSHIGRPAASSPREIKGDFKGGRRGVASGAQQQWCTGFRCAQGCSLRAIKGAITAEIGVRRDTRTVIGCGVGIVVACVGIGAAIAAEITGAVVIQSVGVIVARRGICTSA